MMTSVRSFRNAGVGMGFVVCVVSCPASGEVLKGTVNDLSSPSKGIPGVSLSVRDAKDKELAPGLTNGQGEYSVPYPAQKAGVKVKVIYEKPGFTPRPVVKWIANSDGPQEPVLLLKAGADDEYYRGAAAALETLARRESPGGLHKSAAVVAALPKSDKDRLLRYLMKAPAQDVVEAIKIADADASLVSQVKEAMRDEPSLKASAIDVQTFNGKVQLSGFANSLEAQKKATQVARNVQGVNAVMNELRTK